MDAVANGGSTASGQRLAPAMFLGIAARAAAAWSAVAWLTGAGFAVLSFGTMALNPSAVQWLMISDRGQAFLGWQMARHAPAPYSLPFGSIPGYVAPHGASLALTDSIPWFSLLLLPFSAWLPAVFQHAGMWLVLCYGLMAFVSFRLLLQLSSDPITSFVAMLLVLVNPVLLFRRFHLSLCAHWLIVAALLLYFAPVRESVARERATAAALLVIAAGTHPYLAVMVLGLVAAAAWTHSVSWRSLAATWLLDLVVMGLALWAFGYVGRAELAAPGFGDFSANLLTFLDPDGWSRVMPDVPSGPGQYEGFAFLGVGVLIVSAADLVVRVRRRTTHRTTRLVSEYHTAPLLVVVGALAIFALSSRVRAGSVELMDVSAPYAMLGTWPSTLRASGRFVWPLYYVVMFGALTSLRRSVASRTVYIAIVLVALGAQLADAWPRYSTQNVALMALSNPHRPLRASAWQGIGNEYREIRLIPPAIVDTDCDEGRYPRFYYMPFALVAACERMRLNSGHLSRYASDIAATCREQTDAVLGGALESDVVYVLSAAVAGTSGLAGSPAAHCGTLDGYSVCVSAGRDTTLARALVSFSG